MLATSRKVHNNVVHYTSFFSIFMKNALVNSLLRFRIGVSRAWEGVGECRCPHNLGKFCFFWSSILKISEILKVFLIFLADNKTVKRKKNLVDNISLCIPGRRFRSPYPAGSCSNSFVEQVKLYQLVYNST